MKTLLAGTLVAIPLCALSFGAATSQSIAQSQVTIDQVQLGDVFATGVIDVDDADEQVTQATLAAANTATVGAEGVQVNLDSRQRVYGDVQGSTTINLNSSHPDVVVAVTNASANTLTGTATANGVLIGDIRQRSNGDLVKAGTRINAETGGANYLEATSQAVANSVGLGANSGHLEATVRQSNHADVEGAVGGNIQYVPNAVSFSGTAIANNVTGSGIGGSAMLIDARQVTAGDHVQGTSFLSVGNGQTVQGAATAVGNNIAVNNEGGPLEVRANQTNKNYIRAEAVTAVDQFGTANALAYGVGNSVLAGEFGGELTLDNRQVNSGADIDAIARVEGREGYDMTAQSTAMGNAVTGYACSECGGVIDVNNRQVNRSNVNSTTSVRTTGSNRSMTGTSTAVGNSATFYVTSSGGGG